MRARTMVIAAAAALVVMAVAGCQSGSGSGGTGSQPTSASSPSPALLASGNFRFPPMDAAVVLDATVTSEIEPLAGGRSLLEHVVDYHFRGGPLGEIAARSLARVGGSHLALRHGTLAQKQEIEERYRDGEIG